MTASFLLDPFVIASAPWRSRPVEALEVRGVVLSIKPVRLLRRSLEQWVVIINTYLFHFKPYLSGMMTLLPRA